MKKTYQSIAVSLLKKVKLLESLLEEGKNYHGHVCRDCTDMEGYRTWSIRVEKALKKKKNVI